MTDTLDFCKYAENRVVQSLLEIFTMTPDLEQNVRGFVSSPILLNARSHPRERQVIKRKALAEKLARDLVFGEVEEQANQVETKKEISEGQQIWISYFGNTTSESQIFWKLVDALCKLPDFTKMSSIDEVNKAIDAWHEQLSPEASRGRGR